MQGKADLSDARRSMKITGSLGRVFSFLNSLSEHEKQTHGNKQYCLKLLPLSLGMDERLNMI